MDFSKPDNARKINRLRLLSELRKGSVSKAELSRRLGINKVSIGEMAKELIDEGLIAEGDKDFSSPGRPGRLLSVARNSGRVFSFSVSEKAVSVSVSDMLGMVLRFERYPHSGDIAENLKRAIERMSGDARIYGSAVVAPDETDEEVSRCGVQGVAYVHGRCEPGYLVREDGQNFWMIPERETFVRITEPTLMFFLEEKPSYANTIRSQNQDHPN